MVDLVDHVARHELRYPTIKAAQGIAWFKRHQKAQRKINCKKGKLKDKLLNSSIDKFYETIHFEEVDRQIQGILPDAEVLNPSTIEYQLEERATVARLLFQPFDNLNVDKAFNVRVQLVDVLAKLCHLQETPSKFKAANSKKPLIAHHRLHASDNAKMLQDKLGENRDTQTLVCKDLHSDSPLQCPICEFGSFSRKDSLARHVKTQHLTRRATADGFPCPYEGCSAYLAGTPHFMNHTARQHNLCL
ncbi:hypothetical protein HYALB_00001724 [Hymenoscyphus albidus]|uniref:C2H2-type domain-containing protein n=1 Tax=Hymenoscyphus albidus TaxID=595503 RepID=A0A9N9LIS8_9HELO|nr:hypothetical protein HYALB_00001724 [Hymenoscyphus albidus]